MVISMLKIRRPLGRLIFNMGIAIPGKTVFLIETAPWSVGIAQLTHREVQGWGKDPETEGRRMFAPTADRVVS